MTDSATRKLLQYCREKFPDLTQDEEAAIRRNAIGKGVLFLRCKFTNIDAPILVGADGNEVTAS